jgi:PAS domain S-box-containing protein
MTSTTPKPKPATATAAAIDLLLALGIGSGLVLLQWLLSPWFGSRLPFLLFVPAIIFTAAVLGRWPASVVLVAGAGTVAATRTPAGLSLVSDPADQWALAAYVLVGGLLVAYGAGLRLRTRRAERAEQRLQLAQDETGVGLFELDYRAGTAYVSPALCQILGQPVMAGSMPLQQWLSALNAGHVADSRRAIQAKIDAGELRYERELRVQLPDGSARWLLSRIRLDLDAQGQLAVSRGATLDITARKQLVTELEAAQAQLRLQLDDLNRLHALSNRLLAMPLLESALQATLDAVAAFHGTPVGLLRLVDAHGATRQLMHCGLSGEALAQMEALHAERLSVHEQVAATGQRVVVTDVEEDARFSALRPLLRMLGLRAVHSTPLLAGDAVTGHASGRVLGTLTVLMAAPGAPDDRLLRLTDLCAGQATALIEREVALSQARESQHRFDVALQSSSVAFTILAPVRDETGCICNFAWTYANAAAARMIGRPAHELVGRQVTEVLPKAWEEPGFFARYARVSEDGSTDEFDTCTRGPGPVRWLHVILSPLNGSVVVWFADVTQYRQQQQALEDADKRKDEFLATLAHELRNPLAPMRHAADTLSNAAASPAQQRFSLAIIERQLKHMALLLDDLLDVSRITRGTLALRRSTSALSSIVDAAVETSGPLFSSRGHSLVLALPEEPVWLDVDTLRIAQVLGNLLVNAAKYTEPGGLVRLSACVEGSEVVLAVTDNGRGLRPEETERVFGMFMQVHAAEAGVQAGLGIGLALARTLVQLHKGGWTRRARARAGAAPSLCACPRLLRCGRMQALMPAVKP